MAHPSRFYRAFRLFEVLERRNETTIVTSQDLAAIPTPNGQKEQMEGGAQLDEVER